MVDMTSKVAVTDTFRLAHCSRVPFPSPGDLPVSGIEPRSSTLQADSLPTDAPGKPQINPYLKILTSALKKEGATTPIALKL